MRLLWECPLYYTSSLRQSNYIDLSLFFEELHVDLVINFYFLFYLFLQVSFYKYTCKPRFLKKNLVNSTRNMFCFQLGICLLGAAGGLHMAHEHVMKFVQAPLINILKHNMNGFYPLINKIEWCSCKEIILLIN